MGVDADLLAILDQIPIVAEQPRTVEELPGGLTNSNLKVTTPSGVYVVRVGGSNADVLGIDRDAEEANTRAAAEAGVGAEVFAYRPELHVLVIGFLEGQTLSNESFGSPGIIPRVAAACRRLHEGPRFVSDFDMFERQRGYLETVMANKIMVPFGYNRLAETFDRIREVLKIRDEGTVPCNNDLLAANFIDNGDQIRLIDYEYSGNNDACFELGNIWTECHLTLDQLAELVTSYYGRERRSRLARARLLGAVGQYGWTLWGSIQHAVSPLDYDFWAWANERYEIAQREFNSPDFEQLLIDATLED